MKNPKDYISYSQLVSYEKGRYYEEYILGNNWESVEMNFGKKISDGLESGSDDKDVEFLRMWIPDVDEREKEIIVEIEGVKIKIKLDGWRKSIEIDEYKTGKTKWTQSRADKSDQLTIYSLVCWKKYGKIPKLKLIWIPTMNNGEDIEITGELPKSFETTRTLADYGQIIKRLKVAKKGIDKLYKEI
jgi:hypothetical protein